MIETQHASEIIKVSSFHSVQKVSEDWKVITDVHWDLVGQIFDRNVNKVKAKINAPRKFIQALEPWAKALEAEWELVVHCFAIDAANLPYTNALEWFACVQGEAKRSDLYSLYTPGGKRDEYLESKEFLDALEDNRNPLYPELPYFTHNYRLMESALRLSSRNEGFRNRYLQPYIKAYRAWNTAKSKNKDMLAAFERDGKLRVRLGKGSGSRAVVLNSKK